jgi:ubiquinone/menaquinone biosynthesis C-methylase UbiE
MCEYIGSELELFSAAKNWKQYFAKSLRPHMGDAVLEVGAGIGSTTKELRSGDEVQWTCLEPDSEMAEKLRIMAVAGELGKNCSVVKGCVTDLSPSGAYDTVVYADVLEHIENDQSELDVAATLVKSGGKIVVLAPAYSWLYTEFDAAIGHFRRYSKRSLGEMKPQGMEIVTTFYLDSIGMLTSLANRLILRQNMPSISQISLWDTKLVPISRHVDSLVGFSFGRSIVCVWRKI